MGYSVYTINFLNAIGVHEIPQFRGAVISTVGRDNNLLFPFLKIRARKCHANVDIRCRLKTGRKH